VALFVISPFFFIYNILAYYISIFLAFLVLFFIGMLHGKLSKENLIIAGIKMIIVGIICSGIIFLIEKLRGVY
jgi:predicted membrane protein (TIGR00267 family)